MVVLSERPGHVGQLLIGYASGLSLLYDLTGDRVLALLPWQYGLEAATWCGGSGKPLRKKPNTPATATPPFLGTRLLTAHADGSLGVWQVPTVFEGHQSGEDSGELLVQTLSMMEAPSMPYGEYLFCYL